MAFALLFKFDVDKGDELSDNVEAKLQKKAEGKKLAMAMEKRAKDLANLSLSIRVSADGETKKARVSVLQAGAKQHMIVVAGPKKAIRDALLGASLMKMSDFSMNNVLVVPCETGTEPKSSRGFGEKPVWEEKSYVAEPVGEGWQEFIDAEVKDAVMQSGEMAKEEGIAIVVSNTGKVLRRGVGTVPWRKMVDELNEASGGKKEQTVEIPFLTD